MRSKKTDSATSPTSDIADTASPKKTISPTKTAPQSEMPYKTVPPQVSKPALWSKSFIALLITQFMVALNDNLFRWLIIPIGKWAIGWSENPDQVRTIGALAFLVPFLVFTAYAGYCCDRFNRRKVIISCKIAELIIIFFGIWGILTQSVPFMLVVLFCLGAQSAFFSPAKYSALPSVVPEERISEANGYYTLTTMVACVGGQLLGGFLFVATTLMPNSGNPEVGTGGMYHWQIWAGALLFVAVAGLISSFFIPSMKPVDPGARFPLNPFYQTFADLRFLFRNRFLFWTAIGSSFFWGFSALAQLNIDKFGDEILLVRQDAISMLLMVISFGLALGAMLAGKCSRNRIETGLVPLGAFFIILFAALLAFTPHAAASEGVRTSMASGPFLYAAVGLLLLGTSAGIFDIPLLSMLQTKSPEAHRGRVMAAYNFFSFSAMALFSLFQGILADKNTFGLSADVIWGVCALISLPVLFFSANAFLMPVIDFCSWVVIKIIYRPRITGVENIPKTGGVLLVGNHTSFLDVFLIYCFTRRPIRFVGHVDVIYRGLPTLMAKRSGVIPILPGDRRSVVQAVRTARQALANGEVVCIFPEGGITRSGQLRGFEPGFLAMLKGNDDVPVVPMWVGGLWGSLLAYTKPKDEWKRPRRLMQRATLEIGEPIDHPQSVYQIKRAVEELGVRAMDHRRFPKDRHFLIPIRQMIRNCRKYGRQERLVDSTGVRLTGRQTLLRSLVARRVFRRILSPKEKTVGLLLPTSVGGVLANVAISLNRKIPINLNYTLSNSTLDDCCERTGIKHIITSRKFMQKFPNMKLASELIYVEDALKNVPLSDKLLGFAESLLPTLLLERFLELHKIDPDEIITIVFTSGSTGRPKGAMLSHMNVAVNVQQFYRLFLPSSRERILGALPLFHSFGYTTTLWCPLMVCLGGVYHYNPLDARVIGELCRKEKATILTATATFFRNYLRRCPTEDFAGLDSPVAGAEKLPRELAEAWKEKYGHEIVEGYGTTELSPVLSANIPPCRFHDDFHIYNKPGSIGAPLGGIAVRITDPETGAELPPHTPGMLEVKGPNVMLGYYHDPEKTAAVLRDGWYKTGDIAQIDDDNFLFITGRQSRISKIGGEMVPHIFLEEQIESVLSQAEKDQSSAKKNDAPTEPNREASEPFEALRFAVTAVPDERKGEKIVVLYTALPMTPEEICHALLNANLPPLWVPATQNFHQVASIPLLGTGKPNLKEIRDIALRLYGMEPDRQ